MQQVMLYVGTKKEGRWCFFSLERKEEEEQFVPPEQSINAKNGLSFLLLPPPPLSHRVSSCCTCPVSLFFSSAPLATEDLQQTRRFLLPFSCAVMNGTSCLWGEKHLQHPSFQIRTTGIFFEGEKKAVSDFSVGVGGKGLGCPEHWLGSRSFWCTN